MNIIFHFHLDAITFIVFATFKFLVSIFFGQFVKGPLVVSSPSKLAFSYYYRAVWGLIVTNKLGLCISGLINSRTIVRKVVKFFENIRIVLLAPQLFGV